MSNDYIIDIQHLSKSYGDHKVLDDINFYVRRGEFVTLLGPSGCGKTTLLRQIAGFVAPDEGKILLEGKDISGIPPFERPLNTVFQRYALFTHLDVFDNIAFGLKLQKVPAKEIEVRVKKMLKMVSMTDYEDRSVDSLSGGQQQRVAIARALVNDPVIILADEATGNLDTRTSYEIMMIFQELNRQGKTIAFVTHEPDIATFSGRTVTLRDGLLKKDIINENVQDAKAAFEALPPPENFDN
jgi:spermidine/putrescine transport system ATP-binding protein